MIIRAQTGFSLVETMFALSLLLVVTLGLMPLGIIATTTTENQGRLTTRTAGYAQDKLEQLLALSFADSTTDTRVFPAASLGGSGLSPGGSSNPATPVNLYVDYLDAGGGLLPAAGVTPPTGWSYKRVWQITSPAANLKQVTVTAVVRNSVGLVARLPESTVAALKTNPF